MGVTGQLEGADPPKSGSLDISDRLRELKSPSNKQQLDVKFNTDPLFVRAGQHGVTVPRGLSLVESDAEQPVLNFRSDDAYATASEITRRASAAREMRAALAAQIAAKRMVRSKAVNEDDHYEAHLEASRTMETESVAYATPRPPSAPVYRSTSDVRSSSCNAAPNSCSSSPEYMPLPTSRSMSVDALAGRGPVPPRRAAAARELQGALDAQMRATALLQTRLEAISNGVSEAEGGSTFGYGEDSIGGDNAPSSLATVEGQDGPHDSVCPSDQPSSVHSTPGWHAHLRSRRKSMPATSSSAAATSTTPQVSPPNTSNSTADSHISFEARSLNSARSGRLAPTDDAKAPGKPTAAASRSSSHDLISGTGMPTLRFKTDNMYATEEELAAKAAASARLRADLDRQVAEKQRLREQEHGDEDWGAFSGRFRSPLSHRSTGSGGSGRLNLRNRHEVTPRRTMAASPPSAHSTRGSTRGRVSSPGGDGAPGTGLMHVADSFGRVSSARENDIPGFELAAESALQGLEEVKTGGTPRQPLQPSGNSRRSPQTLSPLPYTSMPTPLFDIGDPSPVATARSCTARLFHNGSATVSADRDAPALPGPSTPERSPRKRRSSAGAPGSSPSISGAASTTAVAPAALGHLEDPVQRSWWLAREKAEVARTLRVRQHAAVASPELVEGLHASGETGESSDAVEMVRQEDSAAAAGLATVGSSEVSSEDSGCSSETIGGNLPCTVPAKRIHKQDPGRNAWSRLACCFCGKP